MKKILAIGDLHGRNNWKEKTTNINEYERIVFLGDYTDHWTYSDEQIWNNLLDVIQLKKDYPDKVILLWGNHDYYYWQQKYGCSGLRPTMMTQLNLLFKENKDLFLMCYQINTQQEKIIFSHAGIHEQWYQRYLSPHHELSEQENQKLKVLDPNHFEIAERINKLHDIQYPYLYIVGSDRGGWHRYGGPLWIDASTLKQNPLKGYKRPGPKYYKITQIVGHSVQQTGVNTVNGITFVDYEEAPFYEIEVNDDYKEYM